MSWCWPYYLFHFLFHLLLLICYIFRLFHFIFFLASLFIWYGLAWLGLAWLCPLLFYVFCCVWKETFLCSSPIWISVSMNLCVCERCAALCIATILRIEHTGLMGTQFHLRHSSSNGNELIYRVHFLFDLMTSSTSCLSLSLFLFGRGTK